TESAWWHDAHDKRTPPALQCMHMGDHHLRFDEEPSVGLCVDVGLDMRIPLTVFPSDVLPPEDTLNGPACLQTQVIKDMLRFAKAATSAVDISVIDCALVAAHDATVTMFAMFTWCSRAGVADMQAWKTELQTTIQQHFQPAVPQVVDANAEDNQRLAAPGQTRYIMVSDPYELPDDESLPAFAMRSMTMWTDDSDKAKKDTKDLKTFVKIEVVNNGAIPLHVFRVFFRRKDSTVVTFSARDPVVVLPRKVRSITLQGVTKTPVEDADASVVYVSHSAFAGHRHEGSVKNNVFHAIDRPVKAIIDPQEKEAEQLSTTPTLNRLFGAFPVESWRGEIASWHHITILGCRLTSVAMLFSDVHGCCRTGRRNCNFQRRWARNCGSCGRVAPKLKPKYSNAESKASSDDNPHSGDHVESTSISKRLPAITMEWTNPDLIKSSPKVLDLDGAARLQPKLFEKMWDSFQPRFHSIRQLQVPKLESSVVITRMESVGVTCMASGVVNSVDKFVFYSKQRNTTDGFFLLTLDVAATTGNMAIAVRSSDGISEQLTEDFGRFAEQQLLSLFAPVTASPA
ncbi:TPA: hypothetical protein N0F65_000605, partial [Lagenidium giganteum]